MKILINEEVKKALSKNEAVVALESTIITHGMPYPQNYEMAKKVEKTIRDKGATPATIAIINGEIKVGLIDSELKGLAMEKNALKVSKRDFGYCLLKKLTGGTTVSGTMLIANMAGIKVFATGGIGGVHRMGNETFDISRDLEELANTNVCVVCAGAKAILDLELTMEFLETKGVEVIGYKTDFLPAFYTNKSNIKVPYKLENPNDIAKLLKNKWQFLNGGVVIANPIPDKYSISNNIIDNAIKNALKDAKKKKIKGKETTPFLLAKVKELTKGKSLDANLELVYNNARLAAEIAIEFSKL